MTWKIIEEKIRRLNGLIKSIANMKSEIGSVTVLAKTWKDSYDHKCEDLKVRTLYKQPIIFYYTKPAVGIWIFKRAFNLNHL